MITGQICCQHSQPDSLKTRRKTASDTEEILAVKVPLTSEYMYTYARCNLQKIMQLAMTTFSPVSMVNWITFNQQRHVLLPLKPTQTGKPLNDMC